MIKPAWIIIEIKVHDQVGHEAWGMYAALLSFAFLFITLADLGINQYTTQKLASEPEVLQEYYPTLLGIKGLLVALFPLVMLCAGWVWGYEGRFLYWLVAISFIHGGTMSMQFFRANFQAQQAFRLDAYASIIEKSLLIILIIFFLLQGIQLEEFIMARLISIGISIFVFIILISRLYGFILPRLNLSLSKKVLSASISFAAITILYSVHDKVDQVMLERLAGEEATSLYSAAYRWMDAVSMYMWIVLALFFARMARFMHDTTEKNKLLKLGQIVTGVPILFIAVFVLFHGEVLIEYLFSQSTPEEWATMTLALKILFIALMVNGLAMIHSTLLTSTGHIRFVNIAIILSIILNIVLNLIFIPEHGPIAAAWSTVASFILSAISYLFYIHFKTTVSIPWGSILRLLIASLILSGVFYLNQLLSIEWYFSILVAGGVYILLIWRLALLPEEFLELLKNRFK